MVSTHTGGFSLPYQNAKIEKSTGDIYSQSGKKPRGNIKSKHCGEEYIDAYGVIVNNKKFEEKLNKLENP